MQRNYIAESELSENEKDLAAFLSKVGTCEQLKWQLQSQLDAEAQSPTLITILHAALRTRRMTHVDEIE